MLDDISYLAFISNRASKKLRNKEINKFCLVMAQAHRLLVFLKMNCFAVVFLPAMFLEQMNMMY